MEITVLKWALNVSVVGAVLVLGYTVGIVVRRLERLENRFEELSDRLGRVKDELPYNFVSKDDWLRAQAKLERKIDRLIEAVIKLEAIMGKEQGGNL